MITRVARVRLTIFYTALITIVSVVFSAAIYIIQMGEVWNSVQTVHVALIKEFGMPPRPERFIVINNEALNEARQNIILKLFYTNLGILAVTGAIAYYIAGRTLRPLEETVRVQKDFISDASHEIRTPLTALRTTLEVGLGDPTLSKDAKETIQDSLTQAIKLQELTTALLNLSQLESTYQLTKTTVSMLKVIDEAWSRVKPKADAKQIQLSLPSFDIVIHADQQKITEVCSILLDNAVKYSPAETTITIQWKRTTSQNIIKFIDQGQGISEDDLPHIFDRFFRADKARSIGDGYGIGLSLAKRIVTMHKGQIEAKNNSEKGTTFTLILPRILT